LRRLNIVALMGVSQFERFFRLVASIDVDKDDLKRFDDFVNDKIYDLLIRGVANAKANNRDVIQRSDLPITKGLQESIHAFRKIDAEVSLASILDQLTRWPPLDLVYDDEVKSRFPEIAGGLGVALGKTFVIIDPDVKNPNTEHWERAFEVFNLLL
jgi:hypothetical protein